MLPMMRFHEKRVLYGVGFVDCRMLVLDEGYNDNEAARAQRWHRHCVPYLRFFGLTPRVE